jgi:hypothetical protein
MPSHVAQVHQVIIFVVPDDALQGDPPPVGPGRPLTARHLANASDHVKKNARALADNVTAVIVIGDKAATFLNGGLVAHDMAIKHAAIRVYTESDQIEWECDRAFTIASTEKAHNPIWYQPGTPDNPFYAGPPFVAECGSDTRYRARSSTTTAAANGQQYKVTITIGGRDVDPDYVCGNPPPI